MKSKLIYIVAVILGLALAACVLLFFGLIVSSLWNFSLMPQGLHRMDMCEGTALILLTTILGSPLTITRKKEK